jgi:hypothetical protein
MRAFWRRSSKQTRDPLERRAYFEVYGDYLAMNQSLKRLCFCLVFINILLLLFLRKTQEKPPLVIRVNEVGAAEPVKNVNASSRLTQAEVLNFVRLFTKFYLERNYYTWKDNLAEAGLMMTPEFRSRTSRESNLSQEITEIESKKLTSKLKFSNVEVVRETKDVVLVSLKGWSQVASNEDPRYVKETVFEAELSLKKVPRTMDTPYGLLVDSYTQTDFKDE